MKKHILLILSVLLLAGCSAKNMETEITVFQSTVPAVYTGKVKRKLPDGEGTALLETNASVKGMFEKGVWISGEAENVPYRVAYQDQTYSGSYTGEAADQLPSGNGVFESESFSYDGTWNNGLPEGTGTITSDAFRINTASETLKGSYTGEIRQGLAEGSGTFIYEENGHEVQMTGVFAGNQFDGRMIRTIRYSDTVRSYPVFYQKGSLVPSAAAMISYLEGMRNESYCLSEAETSFILDHSDLFEGNETDGKTEYNQNFDYDGFQEGKEPSLFLIRQAEIRSIQRYKPYAGSNTVTSMIVQNADGFYHLVFAYSVDEADQGDTADIGILPFCRSILTSPEQDYPAIDAAGTAVWIR